MFVNSPFNYTGNKFKLLEQLLPEFDYDKKYFIDLFCGSFVVSANVLDKYESITSNDIIKELVEIHQRILISDEIIELTKQTCPPKDSSEGYALLRDSFNKDKSPDKLWALMLCCTNNMLRFNQSFSFNQTWGKRSWNSSTEKKIEQWKEHVRLYKNKITLVIGNFSDLKIDSPNSFIYADPPYAYVSKSDGTIGNKQISEAGYNAFWKKQDDINLLTYLLDHDRLGGTFAISGVIKHKGMECWLLNELIKSGFNYKELNFNYDKVSRKENIAETVEVIIKNF